MVRKLKFHEQKLLKKVDFLNWKQDNNHRESEIIARYQLSNRSDYMKYNKICGHIRQLARKLALLQPNDPYRIRHEQLLLEKLYDLGILATKSKISDLENKISVSSFCRRRIGILMVKFKMAQNIQDANKFIKQGHVRVGPNLITDPAYLITRNLEDYLTWVDSSKIKQNVLKYRNKVDDYNLV